MLISIHLCIKAPCRRDRGQGFDYSSANRIHGSSAVQNCTDDRKITYQCQDGRWTETKNVACRSGISSISFLNLLSWHKLIKLVPFLFSFWCITVIYVISLCSVSGASLAAIMLRFFLILLAILKLLISQRLSWRTTAMSVRRNTSVFIMFCCLSDFLPLPRFLYQSRTVLVYCLDEFQTQSPLVVIIFRYVSISPCHSRYLYR